MVTSNVLVLITDSKVAKFYSSKGKKVQHLLKGIKAEKWWKVLLQKGRDNFFRKRGVSSHFLDPHHEAKENERRSFSLEISRVLENILKLYPTECIIVFSEPKMLGELRKNLDPKFKDFIHKEVSKDLTHCTLQEISNHLKNI
ncbi:MAG: host attachment protein [Candidatus Paracaedimonas acanthamoebae]|uniref:Host attachment protein n=1 Tax=Candidatus Paracaedimonas acanthamoebae TaxID=244581 RepID=A0A8J7PX68_9PROT|nr:host attachment protein [Candidatus Paracaedimonas acanthamoebae]